MGLLGLDGDNDELQFLRNLHIVADKSRRRARREATNYDDTKLSPVLQELLQDLSFWDVSSGNPEVRGDQKKKPATRVSTFTFGTSLSSELLGTLCQSTGSRDAAGQDQKADIEASPTDKPIWKSATDPVSGRTYYYDVITRKTQWNEPPEVKAARIRRKEEQRQRDKEFFKEMECNIEQSLARGELVPGIPCPGNNGSDNDCPPCSAEAIGPPLEPINSVSPTATDGSHGKVRVRTISGMDEVLLAELRDDSNVLPPLHQPPKAREASIAYAKQTGFSSVSEVRSGRPPMPHRPFSNEMVVVEGAPDVKGTKESQTIDRPGSDSELAGEALLDGPLQTDNDVIGELPMACKPTAITQHSRRNTGGTIYIENTIYNPDIQATIKCVCGVYRAHIVQAEEEKSFSMLSQEVSDCAEIFSDHYGMAQYSVPEPLSQVPSYQEVLGFYDAFYGRSQMEHDTIIMSLIYVERLVKATNGAIRPAPWNWRSILFSCMVLASKVWDDMSMWNIDFSNVSAATRGLARFTLPRINELELTLLKSLNFDVRVPASEYAKYYFLIRTMLLRSGLVKGATAPLQRKGDDFDFMETKTQKYQDKTMASKAFKFHDTRPGNYSKDPVVLAEVPMRTRVQSLDGVLKWLDTSSDRSGPIRRDNVSLEQLVG
eukprot:Nitzschia sp. Nitz4//scaffold193_size40683//31424//33397//NITZ4_007504-RA/size40683-processed-gene-0.14-mRNA-1//1//CDS//3329540294//4627//frame0